MAKKMKPVSVDAASVADISEIRENDDRQATVIDQIEKRLSDGERAVNGTLTEDVKAKLAAYETAMAENARLSEEISNLQEQLAKYIADNAKNAKSDFSKKTAELESRVAELIDENDKYLMRISELSFENAKLTASIQELNKHLPTASADQANHGMPHNKYVSNPYRGLRDSNGYTSWN